MSSRHRSRELAVQMNYQWDLDPKSLSDPKVIQRFWQEQAKASEDTREFFEILVRGTAEYLPQIDSHITSVLENWRLDRIEKVDLAILRLATFELFFNHDAPDAVVVNEAIEIAKKFGNRDSSSFINGILDALLRRKKQNES